MEEHRFAVPRTARYFTLGRLDERVRQVWFVCHGYGQLAGDFLRGFAPLDDGDRFIVAEGLSRYYTHHLRGAVGASWMTREERLAEIADYVKYLDSLYHHILRGTTRSAVSVYVLGFSQGAATAARWICLGSAVTHRLILWGELIPPDIDLEVAWGKLEDSRLTLVVGRDDTYVKPEELGDVEARLLRHEIPYETVRYAGGHHLDAEVLKSLAAV